MIKNMKPTEKETNLLECLLSIYDSLKLYDNKSFNAKALDDETLSEMMFRKMKAYNIDLNKELNFTHLKPVKSNKGKIHEKIEKLIPYVPENFITFPLHEEGKYIPFVNFWQIAKTEVEYNKLEKKLKKIHKDTCYTYYITCDVPKSGIFEIRLYPKFTESKKGGYKFSKDDWCLEDMFDIIIEFLNQK